MIGQLIDVLFDDSTISLAKIVEVDDSDSKFKVKYMVPSSKKYGDKRLYKYDSNVETIDKECVNGYYDTENEEIAGYVKTEYGFILCDEEDDESDYDPSESEEEESESEEEDDEDEDEEDDLE